MNIRATVFAALSFFCAFAMADVSPIQIGSDKQLFIDTKLINRSEKIVLSVNPPIKRGIAFEVNAPWENLGITGACVVQDGNVVHMYYRANAGDANGANAVGYTCYARSSDGVTWTKPDCNQVAFENSRHNNLLDVPLGYVYRDDRAEPDKRYKLAVNCGSDVNTGGVYMYYSADAIRWKKMPQRLFPFYYDSEHNQICFDPSTNKYKVYFRQWQKRSDGMIYDAPIKPLRAVGMLEINQVDKPWMYDQNIAPYYIWGKTSLPSPYAEGKVVLSSDQNDPPETDICNGGVHCYSGAKNVWLAFVNIYRHFPEPADGKWVNDGMADVQLAVSSDGASWRRFPKPYLSLDEGFGSIFMAQGMVRRGNEILQFYCGGPATYGQTPTKATRYNIYYSSQRLDGFVSIDAGNIEGYVITKPLVFAGQKLVLNVDASAMGQLQVEMADSNEIPVQGFAASDCDLIRGNHSAKIVTWKGRDDIKHLAGTVVRIKFVLRNAKLYSFEFKP